MDLYNNQEGINALIQVISENEKELLNANSEDKIYKKITASQSSYDIAKEEIRQAEIQDRKIQSLAKLINSDKKVLLDALKQINTVDREGKIFFANYSKSRKGVYNKNEMFFVPPDKLQSMLQDMFNTGGKNLTEYKKDVARSFMQSMLPQLPEPAIKKALGASQTGDIVASAMAGGGGAGGGGKPPVATGGGGGDEAPKWMEELVRHKLGPVGLISRFLGGGVTGLARGFVGYESVHLLEKLAGQVAEAKRLGGLTGEGLGAGVSAKFQATKYHLTHPLQVVGGREALDIMRTVRGAGFRGEAANVGMTTIADTANKLNISSEAFRDMAIQFVRSMNPASTKATIDTFKEFKVQMDDVAEVTKKTGGSLKETIDSINSAVENAKQFGGKSAVQRAPNIMKAFSLAFPSVKKMGQTSALFESIARSPMLEGISFAGGGRIDVPEATQEAWAPGLINLIKQQLLPGLQNVPRRFWGARLAKRLPNILPGLQATTYDALIKDILNPKRADFKEVLHKENVKSVSKMSDASESFYGMHSALQSLTMPKGFLAASYDLNGKSLHEKLTSDYKTQIPINDWLATHVQNYKEGSQKQRQEAMMKDYNKFISDKVEADLSIYRKMVPGWENYLTGKTKDMNPNASSTEINKMVGESIRGQKQGETLVKILVELDPKASKFFKKLPPKEIQMGLNNLEAVYGTNPNKNRHGSRMP